MNTLAAALAMQLVASPQAAGQAASEEKAPIPEPLLSETVTDIDGTEAGEVEVEVNGSVMRALHGGERALDTSLEVEWLVTRRLGLRLEPTLSRDSDGSTENGAGLSGGLSWKVLQDFAHDLHVDAELLTRVPWNESPIVQPGDPAQPVALDLRGAWRRDLLSLRWSGGVGAFGASGRVPLRGSVAALLPFESSGRFGFWGVELDADGARPNPLVAALDVVPNLEPAGLPLRLGLALPWFVGSEGDRPALGILLRVFYESAREIEFGSNATGR